MAINDPELDMLLLQDSLYNNVDRGMLEREAIRKIFADRSSPVSSVEHRRPQGGRSYVLTPCQLHSPSQPFDRC